MQEKIQKLKIPYVKNVKTIKIVSLSKNKKQKTTWESYLRGREFRVESSIEDLATFTSSLSEMQGWKCPLFEYGLGSLRKIPTEGNPPTGLGPSWDNRP